MSENKPPKHYRKLMEKHPDYMEAVNHLGQVVRQKGAIDEKTGHLIQLAASAALRLEGPVHSHARRALAAGAEPGEVREALMLLTSTLGFPTVSAALSWVQDSLDD